MPGLAWGVEAGAGVARQRSELRDERGDALALRNLTQACRKTVGGTREVEVTQVGDGLDGRVAALLQIAIERVEALVELAGRRVVQPAQVDDVVDVRLGVTVWEE